MKSVISLLILFLVISGKTTFAQDLTADNLKQMLLNMKEDSNRVNTLNELGYLMLSTHSDQAITYSLESKALALKIAYKKGLAEAYKNTGLGYYMQGNYTEALKNWERALELFAELGNDQRIANIYNKMGAVYYTIGNYMEAIAYYLRSLKLAEKLADKKGIATLYLNIGVVYSEMPATYDSARNYYLKAIQLGESIGELDIMGLASMDLGEVLMEKEAYDSALYYLEKSLILLTSPIHIASSLNFMGSIFSVRGEYQKAISYHTDALEMAKNEHAQGEIVAILLGLAYTYEVQGDAGNAIEYYHQAETLAKEIGLSEELSDSYEGLATNYAETGDFTSAYKYLELQNTIEDTFYRMESENQAKDLINTYQMDKKQVEIEVLQQRSEIEQLNSRRQKAIILSTGLLGVLLLAVAFGLNSRMKYIRKTNEKMNAQNKLITDSITYAQRIQNAILPSTGLLEKVMPEHFVLLKPKDIISGDFYWIKEVNDHLVIAGADCTGHGVPGAFMSMLGITLLNDLIGDHCYDAPCNILEQLRLKLKDMLAQDGRKDEQKDGMDMGLAILNRTTRELHFAGANHPLYLFRETKQTLDPELHAFSSIKNNNYQLYVLKGDPQPIGAHWEEHSFTNHSVRLQENDSFYIFSDGYVDQFGGGQRKKFKSTNFKRLLLSLQDKSMAHQKQILEDTFEVWKGDEEQIDDVSVIGVRV